MTIIAEKKMLKPYFKTVILISLLVGFSFLISYFNSCVPVQSHVHISNDISFNASSPPARTLVVYVYGKTHAYSEQNLQFFIRTAVRESHHADYYFILQQIDNISFDETQLPPLPSNAHYIQHENKCFDIGTIGWFLASGRVEKTKYRYFIFLNSSVRGPFIVPYYDSPVWYTIFTRRLINHIKLVGCTIHCYMGPHVQSYLWALDFDGLNFLLKSKTVFKCHRSKEATIEDAEVGASKMLLQAGFGIDSLMKKYQGTDFRLGRNRRCNEYLDPTFNKLVDRISLDPFEIVFVKVKDQGKTFDDNRRRVEVYESWMKNSRIKRVSS